MGGAGTSVQCGSLTGVCVEVYASGCGVSNDGLYTIVQLAKFNSTLRAFDLGPLCEAHGKRVLRTSLFRCEIPVPRQTIYVCIAPMLCWLRFGSIDSHLRETLTQLLRRNGTPPRTERALLQVGAPDRHHHHHYHHHYHLYYLSHPVQPSMSSFLLLFTVSSRFRRFTSRPRPTKTNSLEVLVSGTRINVCMTFMIHTSECIGLQVCVLLESINQSMSLISIAGPVWWPQFSVAAESSPTDCCSYCCSNQCGTVARSTAGPATIKSEPTTQPARHHSQIKAIIST